MDQPLFQYLLRMGDTSLILSHRLSELTGHGPALEEDLAMTNVALDLLGQSRLWLTLAGEVEGQSRDEDQLAYLRDAPEYRNYLLVERPNTHYGSVIARQFLFDTWHYFLLKELCSSSDERVAAIAEKSIKEVTYHVRRSSDILVRLGDGTAESHARMQVAVNDAWRFVGELFLDDEIIFFTCPVSSSRPSPSPSMPALLETQVRFFTPASCDRVIQRLQWIGTMPP